MYDDFNVPRLMEFTDSLDIDNDLKEIIESRGGNRVLSITEYQLKPLYLFLCISFNINKVDSNPILILSLTESESPNKNDSLLIIKDFGRYDECELVFDAIRCSHYESITMQTNNRIYFGEFIRDCKGQQVSMLNLLYEIYDCFDYHVPANYRKKIAQNEIVELSKN
jgi:hypothetical protein